MFLATEEDNKFLFEKLKNHFRKWFSGDFKGEEEDLVLINMIAKAPRLNLELANNILGEDRVLGVLGNNHNKIPNSI